MIPKPYLLCWSLNESCERIDKSAVASCNRVVLHISRPSYLILKTSQSENSLLKDLYQRTKIIQVQTFHGIDHCCLWTETLRNKSDSGSDLCDNEIHQRFTPNDRIHLKATVPSIISNDIVLDSNRTSAQTLQTQHRKILQYNTAFLRMLR